MTLGILLLHSDIHGNPNRFGNALHFCVLTDEARPVPVNQMSLIGRVNDNHTCGVATVISAARTRGLTPPSADELEVDEGTSNAGTTTNPGVTRGLARCGFTGIHTTDEVPGPMWVMNPAWGGVIPAEQSQPYLDAAARGWPGGCFVAVDPIAITSASGTPLTPAIPQEDSVHWFIWHDVVEQSTGKTINAAFMSDGCYVWNISGDHLSAIKYIWAAAEAATGRKLLINYNDQGTSVADLNAFAPGGPLPGDAIAAAACAGKPIPL